MRETQLNDNLAFRQDWNKIKKRLAAQVTLDTPDAHLGPGVYVDLISTPVGQRGQGHASQAMRALLSIADKHGVTVFLSPEALGQGHAGALKQADLEKWYSKLGFTPVDGDDWTWARYP